MAATPPAVAHPRLRPGLPILQRSADSLQIGLDPAYALVLSGTDERLSDFLTDLDGTEDPGLLAHRHGVPDDVRASVMSALARAGILEVEPSAPPAPTVRLIGAGLLARCFAERFLAAGPGELLLCDSSRPDDRIYRHLRTTGAQTLRTHLISGSGSAVESRIRISDHWSIAGAVGDVTVVATDRLEPDRALTDELLRLDQPHLLLRPLPDGAVVGPWVTPGASACTRCLDLVRCEDPAWPTVLAQLCRLTARPPLEAAEWAATLAVVQLRAWQYDRPVETLNATIELDSDWVTRARHWPAHPACGCRTLE